MRKYIKYILCVYTYVFAITLFADDANSNHVIDKSKFNKNNVEDITAGICSLGSDADPYITCLLKAEADYFRMASKADDILDLYGNNVRFDCEALFEGLDRGFLRKSTGSFYFEGDCRVKCSVSGAQASLGEEYRAQETIVELDGKIVVIGNGANLVLHHQRGNGRLNEFFIGPPLEGPPFELDLEDYSGFDWLFWANIYFGPVQ